MQEFLGYCLPPTTKGQKMLMLIGKGGEGKSRIALVMRSLLGDSMNTTSIQKVESNRFSRADSVSYTHLDVYKRQVSSTLVAHWRNCVALPELIR